MRPPLVSFPAVVALLRRPDLWGTAIRVAAATAEPGWWRRWPPLPRPPVGYATFRHQTMWGQDTSARLGETELIGYLKWCATMRNLG